MRLVVVTPEAPLVDTEVDSVEAPGSEGEFGVLPGHEPLLAPLAAGELRYKVGGSTQTLEIKGGFAEVTSDAVTVLAD